MLAAAMLCLGCRVDQQPAASTTTLATTSTPLPLGGVEQLRGEVLSERTHDPAMFTQGLELAGATLYESSGLYGSSLIRTYDRTSGATVRTQVFEPNIFAEGLTVIGDRVIVLSWREQTAFVLDATTLAEHSRISYQGEGWGICALGNDLVTSDGSDVLSFRDPTTLAVRRSVKVLLDDTPVRELNELECAKGAIFANVWRTSRIVRIDPTTGAVTGLVELAELRPESTKADPDAVMNGIAYDQARDRFLITGKRWPKLYEVRFVRSS
jgi:glutaminyl-peptide cyclotransferase